MSVILSVAKDLITAASSQNTTIDKRDKVLRCAQDDKRFNDSNDNPNTLLLVRRELAAQAGAGLQLGVVHALHAIAKAFFHVADVAHELGHAAGLH